MTRAQRGVHTAVFRALAVLLLAALALALARRQVVAENEAASLGRTPLHDASAGGP